MSHVSLVKDLDVFSKTKMHSDFYSFKYLNAMRRFISASIAASLLLFSSTPVRSEDYVWPREILEMLDSFKKEHPHLSEEYCMKEEVIHYRYIIMIG